MTNRLTVVLLTASVGGGHDGPAQEIARQLREADHLAMVRDLIRIGPGGRLLRSLFHAVLTMAPGSWGALFRRFDATGRLPPPIRILVDWTGRRLARRLRDENVSQIVCTFPLAAGVAAVARARLGRPIRIVVYVTDPAVHRLWIHPAVDLYLTTWALGPQEIAPYTNAPVAVVAPAVRPEFRTEPRTSNAATRLVHGLPKARLALVTSGSWGVGDVLGSVRDLLADTDFVPVVACGANGRLRRRVGRIPGAVALGWTDDMAGLMRACSVAVLNSGGLTLAEAAGVGLPVIHHRPLPGQGVSNAQICAALTRTDVRAGLDDELNHAVALTDFLGTADILATLSNTPPRAEAVA